MEDSRETLQQYQKRQHEEAYNQSLFLGKDLPLNKDSIPWIYNHIDRFVSLSRGNKSVKVAYLSPYSVCNQADEVRDKLGQAFGNLQALERILIYNYEEHDDDEVVPIPDWERLARILRHIRQKIKVEILDQGGWAVGEVQALARAISRGHPTIT
jgi:hypothetical protein